MKNYNVKRYIKVLSGKIVDTSLLLPHVECYLTEDSKLYVESIDGIETYLGKIVSETNNLEDLVNDVDQCQQIK